MANPINNKTVLRNLEKLAKDLNKKVSIRVGIIGDKAHQIHSDTNLTNADLGAIHEFGATINVTDKMRGWFWYNYGIHKSNKAINIPARSFLRMPLLSEEGKKEIMKYKNPSIVQQEYWRQQWMKEREDYKIIYAELLKEIYPECHNCKYLIEGMSQSPYFQDNHL